MRALDEGIAGAEDIDRAIRDGGGFRMGENPVNGIEIYI